MKALTSILWAVFVTVADGALFLLGWNWFVIPTFATAPHLHLAVAVGLMTLIGLVTYTIPISDVIYAKDFQESTEYKIMYRFAKILVLLAILLIMVVAHLFM